MTKPSRRWPMWRIGAAGVLCALTAGVLFWLSTYLERWSRHETSDQNSITLLTVPGFIQILGMAAAILAILGFVWLGVRIKEARTPPWERKGKSKRR
ncbi:MAG: hypothetical protein V2A79_04975 [Planctomycetota bacterium]